VRANPVVPKPGETGDTDRSVGETLHALPAASPRYAGEDSPAACVRL